MLRVIVLAPSPALRERVRTLVRAEGSANHGGVEIAGETGDPARAHLLALQGDALIVWGPALLAQAAAHLDPGADERAEFDRDVPSYAVIAIANDRRVTATLETLPVRGWAVVLEDATRDEVKAAIQAADAGLGAMPVEWTARQRTLGRSASSPSLRSANLSADDDRALDWIGDGVADERLTSREQEVLEWLSQGLSNRRIAERLGISEHTVKFHITAIYGKLGASTRTEAVNRALRRGWLRI
jgi:DNA-binding NarL/FixJ family response regulator